MKKFITEIEKQDTYEIINSKHINMEYLKNSTILVTGATGLIGFQVILACLTANKLFDLNIKILALARNAEKVKSMFGSVNGENIEFLYQDIEQYINYKNNVDYIIHTANTTSSQEMTENPVETITSIINGTNAILKFAKDKKIKSMIYLSSMEVYGDIPIEQSSSLSEDDYGYLSLNKPRNSYPVGKRAAEALCFAYYNEYNVPVKIARLAQTIGAGVNYNDKRVFAEFARCIVEKNDIILKTSGETVRSYIYITDAISAILSMLEKGKDGEYYNIANPKTTCSIRQMAETLCNTYKTSNLQFSTDDKYYPKPAFYLLNTEKFCNSTGWKPYIDLDESYKRLINSFIIQNKNEQLK